MKEHLYVMFLCQKEIICPYWLSLLQHTGCIWLIWRCNRFITPWDIPRDHVLNRLRYGWPNSFISEWTNGWRCDFNGGCTEQGSVWMDGALKGVKAATADEWHLILQWVKFQARNKEQKEERPQRPTSSFMIILWGVGDRFGDCQSVVFAILPRFCAWSLHKSKIHQAY